MPRSRELEKLKNKLRKHQFVALSGPAYSGKSWLCNELKSSLEEKSQGSKVISDRFRGRNGMKWKVANLQLNHFSGPYRQLAKCLASPSSDILVPAREKVSPLFEDEIWEKLRKDDNRGLCDLYEESEFLKDYNLLIIVDQFENLFSGTKFRTEVRNEDQKNFIRLLLKASKEEQLIYLAVSIRPPKSERWKYQFKDLWEAMHDAEFPVYALNQEGLEKAIWRSYREESIQFQERYHQQRQGSVPPNLKPFALDPDKHQAWAEHLYFHEDPLTAMGSLVAETVVADWKNKDEKQIFAQRSSHPYEEDEREIEDSMVELDDEGYDDVGEIEESIIDDDAGSTTYGNLADKAEQLYSWLTPLEKRVSQKFFNQLVLAGGPLPMADAISNIGRFESMVYQVVDKYVKEGVLQQSPSGPIDGATQIEWVEPELEDAWERVVKWTGRTVSRSAPAREERSSTPKTTTSGRSRTPARAAASTGDAGGANSSLSRKAEHVYSELLPLHKRVTEKIFIALAQQNGSDTLGNISSSIGRFETLIPEIAEQFSKMGVIEAKGHADDPSTLLTLADPDLATDWDRLATWLSRQGIKMKAPKKSKEDVKAVKAEKRAKSAPKAEKAPSREKAPPRTEAPRREPVKEAPKKAKPQPRTRTRQTVAAAAAQSGGADAAAEHHYQSMTPLDKRVTEKIFVTLSHNGGSMLVGDLVDSIGRFEGIVRNQVEEWDKVKVLDCEGRDDENRVALADLDLSKNWKRYGEWLKRA